MEGKISNNSDKELEKHAVNDVRPANPVSEDASSGSRAQGDDDDDDDFGFSPAEKRSIIRRMDVRLVFIVGMLYCISLIDRLNMSVANVAGMSVELNLIGNRYNVANLVFFVTYTVFQFPSTILVRAIGPRLHLASIVLIWGAVMIGMGFVKDFGQLAALRTVLGLFEAGLFPSCVYLLSTWYTRYEVGKRFSGFYLISCVTAGFCGALAWGLVQLNGRGGLAGWRWIFIVEGILTCAIAVVGYWLLIDFPDSKRRSWGFLSQRERDWVVQRIQRDRGDSRAPPFSLRKFLGAARDWKIWGYAMVFFCTTTTDYAMAYTLPVLLINNMGFSIGEALVLMGPPYAFSGLVMVVTSWAGDRFRLRGPVILVHMALCLVGLPLMGWASSPTVRYVGVFLAAGGAASNVPAAVSLQANNVRGQWKRAFCSASQIGFGGIGGIAGSLVFREQDAATGYKPGLWACIACSLLTVVIVLVLDLEFWRLNRKADVEGKVLEAEDDDDASVAFRYTY